MTRYHPDQPPPNSLSCSARVQITVKTLRGEFSATTTAGSQTTFKLSEWIKKPGNHESPGERVSEFSTEESLHFSRRSEFVAKYEHTFERSLPSVLCSLSRCFWGLFARFEFPFLCKCVCERAGKGPGKSVCVRGHGDRACQTFMVISFNREQWSDWVANEW